MTGEQPGGPSVRIPAILAVLAAAAIAVVAAWRYRPPPARDATAPADVFSAARARAALARVLGDQRPHPLGSAANREVRTRLVAELANLGLEPETRTAVVAAERTVARVHNVVARIPGREAGPAVMIAAHHDSVGAGPGASDDGAAVAAMIEVARALLAGPPPRHPVLLLFDDGEELGLFGARAFCAEAAGGEEVAVVLNFEARGTRGPSIMFESCGDDRWILEQVRRPWQPPILSSAFAAAYALLPNNTDLSVFRRHGLTGLNFAFVGGVQRYHTPLDTLEHLDDRSLQHHGDAMLSAARQLAGADLAARTPGRAVYFDLLGFGPFVFPLGYEPWLGAAGLVLLALLVALLRGRGLVGGRALGLGLLLPWGICAAAILLGTGIGALLDGLGLLPTPFPRDPTGPVLACFLAAAAATFAAAATIGRRIGTWGCFVGVQAWMVLTGVAAAVSLPGSGFPLALPALAALAPAVCLGALGGRSDGLVRWLSLPGVVATTLLFAPWLVQIHEVVGCRVGGVLGLVYAVLMLPHVPVLPPWLGRRAPAILVPALASLAAVGFTALHDPVDAAHPRPYNLHYLDRGAGGGAGWYLPEARRAVLATVPTSWLWRRPLPWLEPGYDIAARDLPPLPLPDLEIEKTRLENGWLSLAGSIASRRDAPYLELVVPRTVEVRNAVLGGVELEATARRGATRFAFLGAEPGEPIQFRLELRGVLDDLWACDRTLGLPDGSDWILRARQADMGAAYGIGDTATAARRMPLR